MDVKFGQDRAGLFAIVYGPGGIKWVRGERAERIAQDAGLKKTVGGDFKATGYLSAAGTIIQAIAQLGIWYEMRQMRLLEEAKFEERRLIWLVNCASLVLNDMHANGRLDSKETFYLSREAQHLFEAVEKNNKVDFPGTILYMCHRIHQNLAEFNAASYEVLSSTLRDRGVLSTQKSVFAETLEKIFGSAAVPNDLAWLEYHSAEEQLEAALALAREKKSSELDWKDIAKSTVLLAAFVPIPVFWGAGIARGLLTIGGLTARHAAAIYSFQPLYRTLKGLLKDTSDIKKAEKIEEYQDLLLLQFEAANTSRLISVQTRLLAGMEQEPVILFGHTPIEALPTQKEVAPAGYLTD